MQREQLIRGRTRLRRGIYAAFPRPIISISPFPPLFLLQLPDITRFRPACSWRPASSPSRAFSRSLFTRPCIFRSSLGRLHVFPSRHAIGGQIPQTSRHISKTSILRLDSIQHCLKLQVLQHHEASVGLCRRLVGDPGLGRCHFPQAQWLYPHRASRSSEAGPSPAACTLGKAPTLGCTDWCR